MLTTAEVALPAGAVTLTKPRSADDLLSEADFERDERLPYWADIWPSSTALASIVAGLDGRGKRCIELGCGLGLVTIGAMRAGYDVLATDYYDDALLFARRNARAATGREPATRMVDWRAFPSDLGRFDLVLASDVLYERQYADLVAQAIVASLKPGGIALIEMLNILEGYDLRREGVSRLFEAGYAIPEVAKVSGHLDWSMLKIYTEISAKNVLEKFT